MALLHQGSQFIKHFFLKVDQHSLHSPLLFNFYNQVLATTLEIESAADNEEVRREFLRDQRTIQTTDYGTGNNSRQRIMDIASKSLSTPRFSKFLYRTALFFRSKSILELGTSLGINSLYLSSVPGGHLTTIEGCPETAEIARDSFQKSGRSNLQLINQEIESALEDLVNQQCQFDLIFIDANHDYQPTLSYFAQCKEISNSSSIIIIHDIHQSAAMDKAWCQIKEDPETVQTVDFFECGMVLRDPGLTPQNLYLSF